MRSMLYCPADNPSMMINASVYGADAVIYDLEDAVAEENKDQARILLKELLNSFDLEGTPVIVRINGLDTPHWEDDIKAVLTGKKPVSIRVPKAEEPERIAMLSRRLDSLELERGLQKGSTQLQLLIETPKGLEYAYQLAGASPRVSALGFGAEDYCRMTGIRRNGPLFALDYARSVLVNAAAAYGLEFHDCVWGFLDDMEGLEAEAERSRALGAAGKSVIHPKQIKTVNRVFSPTDEEIAWAEQVLASAGGGVTSVNGRMVDAPVVAQAQRILDAARAGKN